MTNGSGAPVVGYVEVYLLIDADAKSSNLPLVAAGSTDAAGYFFLTSPNTSTLSSVAARNGDWVNLEIIANDGSILVPFSLARRFQNGSWSAPRDAAPVSVSVAPDAPGSVRMSSALASGVEPTACGGTITKVISTSDVYTVVGELHTKGDTDATFTYGKYADSDVDVGYSTSKDGPFSVSGSVHIGNSKSNAVTWNRGSGFGKKLRSQFRYKKYRTVYGCGGESYSVKATAWNGGAIEGDDVSSNDGQCDSTYYQYRAAWGKNTSFTRSSENALKFGGAFTVFGFSAGAQSGFSTYVKTTWSFGNNVNYHYLCGNNAKPPSAARVFAGPNSDTLY